MIMPPGQHHTVYNPVAGFSRGGHFFNLDTMHLMELSRFVDNTQGEYVTNDIHYGTLGNTVPYGNVVSLRIDY